MAIHSSNLLLLPALLASLAPGQERSRFDIVRYDAPAGWTKAEADGVLRFTAAGGEVRVDLARGTPLEGTLEAHTEALIETCKALPEFRLEVAMLSGWHRKTNGRWTNFVYSVQHPQKTGTFQYVAVISVAAGGRAVSFTLTSDTAAGYDQNREALGAMANEVELSSGQRLERGTPPLTRYMVDETVDFLEWLVHSPLTEEQKRLVETDLRRSWKEKVKDEMQGVSEMLAARAELAKLTDAERELTRQTVLNEALEQWRKDKDDAGARMMLAIYDEAHQPIAAGEPPLTRQAVEAFAEYLAFAAGRTVGCDGKLPKETREKLIAGVAEGYAELSKQERELIAGMPMLWAALRVAWPGLPAEQQQDYIASWRQQASIAAIGKTMQELDALQSMRDLHSRQMQMQAMQMQFQVMQNVMRAQNDTMRIMSSNLGGNTRYEYRW